MAKLSEAVAGLRKVADALEKAGSPNIKGFPESMLSGEAAVGAAGLLCYLRDLITASGQESWSKPELLVLLEICSRDSEVFPNGTGVLMWDMEDEGVKDDVEGV